MRLIGDPVIGEGVSIAAPSEVMAKGALVVIERDCDIAAFVTISCADSHGRCLGLVPAIERRAIVIEDHVFIGTGAVILGGTRIGHHSAIGAGVVLKGATIPPYSRVRAPEPIIEPGFYQRPRT